MAITVTVDTTDLDRGLAKLVAGLEHLDAPIRTQAEAIAHRVADLTPVRSGRLRATVAAVTVPGGAGVTYGGGLPYADYIDRRSHATEQGTAGAERQIYDAVHAAAAKVVNGL